jgi:hypothetical protein
MTVDGVREIALALPGAHEDSHFEAVDFRVRNRIFIALPNPSLATVRLSIEEQQALLAEDPVTFEALKGYWGRQGWTRVKLDAVDPTQIRELIIDAWRRLAPKRVVAAYDAESS